MRRIAALRFCSEGGLPPTPHAQLSANATLSGEQAREYSSPSLQNFFSSYPRSAGLSSIKVQQAQSKCRLGGNALAGGMSSG